MTTTTSSLPALRTNLLRAAALCAAFSFGFVARRASSETGEALAAMDGFPPAPQRESDDAGRREMVSSWGRRLEEGKASAAARSRRRTLTASAASSSDEERASVATTPPTAVSDEVWSEIRRDMFSEYQFCRFNKFHEPETNFAKIYLDKGATTYENRWRRRMKRETDRRGRKKARKLVLLREKMMSERKLRHNGDDEEEEKKKKKDKALDEETEETANARSKRPISFLHVGKAGGSTISCHIRAAFGDMHANCNLPPSAFPPDQPDALSPESALSKLIDCYDHCSDHPHCYHVNKSFLVNVRNPIDRIKSWYVYEHVWNAPYIDPGRAGRGPRCGALMVSSCYSSLDEFATVGLGTHSRRSPSSEKEGEGGELRVGNDLTPEECSRWAHAAVRGTIPSNFHNAFNYDWYASDILSRKPSDIDDIFVLRLEHLDHDWRTVDVMVGGTGESLPNVMSPANSAAGRADVLPLTDNYVSPEGVRNLCRALCEEIQVYKKLLSRAANLNEEDRERSVTELRRTCPEEVDIEPRRCSL